MEWRDQGALLSVRRHGETSAIIEVFTARHGKHAGVVRGGTSRKIAPILQAGAQIDVRWSARLEEHIGTYAVEPIQSRAAALMSSRLTLAALNAATGLLTFCLPDREPHPHFYERTVAMLDHLGQSDAWPLAYLRWELALLDEMGFGLDLSCCAVTGGIDDLAYVSPNSGRAVSAEGAGEWADKLLPLPHSLMGHGDGQDMNDIARGLTTTGFFLKTRLAAGLGKELPEARERFVAAVRRQG